jgi:hypothetical protein
VLTIFSVPKAFEGDTGSRQCRAVKSWATLGKVVLVGDEPGVAEAAASLGVDHVGDILRNEQGTPRLDSAFAGVRGVVPPGLDCFVNADVVLTDDLVRAVGATRRLDRFLLVGQTRDLEIDDLVLDDPVRLRQRALRYGRMRGSAAIDWFLFSSGLFDPVPPFLVGRAGFDNWMIWRARQVGPVIDATQAVVAIHQPHDYAHLEHGKDEAYYGPEAKQNLALAGGKAHVYTLHDASHKMRADLSIHRNLGAVLRTREIARKVSWKLGMR